MGSVCRLWDFKREIVPDADMVAEALALRTSTGETFGWPGRGCALPISKQRSTCSIAKGVIADGVAEFLRGCGGNRGVMNWAATC